MGKLRNGLYVFELGVQSFGYCYIYKAAWLWRPFRYLNFFISKKLKSQKLSTWINTNLTICMKPFSHFPVFFFLLCISVVALSPRSSSLHSSSPCLWDCSNPAPQIGIVLPWGLKFPTVARSGSPLLYTARRGLRPTCVCCLVGSSASGSSQRV